MARQRSTDPRKPVSLSLRSSTLETVARAAERANKTPGAFLSDQVEGKYGFSHAPPSGCPHPKDREEKILTGTKGVLMVRCGACGAKVR